MYPDFLDMGYEPSLFWSLSLDEIADLFESYTRREQRRREELKAQIRDTVTILYHHATQCADAISFLFPHEEGKQPISLAQYYPELFPEVLEAEKERDRNNEIALHKARMTDYAYRHNEALRRRGENNGRNDT